MLSHFIRKLRPTTPEPLRVERMGGAVWRIRTSAGDLLGDAPDWEEWQRRGWATLVKSNWQRSIWRVLLPAGSVYFKLCRANTPRAWVREILRPPKAQLEFENALNLQRHSIGCIEPLAWGAAAGLWPGESFIISREAPAALPLDQFLEAPLPPQRRRELATAFGEFLGAMHRAGFMHPDPHPGNFLIDWPGGGKPNFVLLDVHAIRRSSNRAALLGNLVILNRWFQLRASRTDRARFRRAYGLGACDAKTLETATRKSNLRFWRNRLGRYLGNNREYRTIRGEGVRGHAVRDLPDDLLQPWLADPDFPFADPSAVLWKDSPSSTVALGPRSLVYKRFRRGGFLEGLKNRLRPSTALRSWIAGQSLRDRGLPTARPLAVLTRTRTGLPREGYLIFELVPGAVELPEAVERATPPELRKLIADLARLLRDLHDRGVSHRDLKAPNILIASRGPVLIDLVGVRLGGAVPERERLRNLARLNASFYSSPVVSLSDRLRFLKTYSSWSAHPVPNWKRFWRALAAEDSSESGQEPPLGASSRLKRFRLDRSRSCQASG